MNHPLMMELAKATDYWGWVQGLYLAKNDCGIALRLHNGYEYEPQSRKLWRSLCKDADLVVDVGAHTGVYSLDAWKAGAKDVLSIEPYHLNYARLVMNLRHSGFSSDAAIYCALGDENALSRFSVTAPNSYCTAGGALGKGGQTEIPVMVRRLDTLIKSEHHASIKVIKIDTERHGLRVLRGMPEILSHKPDLILECIEDGMGEILKPLGYRFFKIHEQNGLSPVEDLTPDNPITHDSPNRYATVN